MSEAPVEAGLRQLAFAVQRVRLYPSESPVVRAAIGRTLASLRTALRGRRLSIEVLPSTLRCDQQMFGERVAIVAQLAGRLHYHRRLLPARDLSSHADRRTRRFATHPPA